MEQSPVTTKLNYSTKELERTSGSTGGVPADNAEALRGAHALLLLWREYLQQPPPSPVTTKLNYSTKELERTSGSTGGVPAVAVSGYMAKGGSLGVEPGLPPNFASTLTTNLGGVGSVTTDDYLEPIAKGYKTYDNCGYWSIVGECLNGHRFAKELTCGREWCSNCRDDTNRRRLARWLPKAQQIETMGYLVVTTPPDKRYLLRNKQGLRWFRRAIIRWLKRNGYLRGLSRYHYFGDKSTNYYPHLNLLLDAGYLSKDDLKRLQRFVMKLLDTDMVVINYHYTKVTTKMLHWLRYVTRSTFLDRSWDTDLADELYRFNNCHCWGNWKSETRWELPPSLAEVTTISSLEQGYCPYCGSPIEWIGGFDNLERTHELERLGYSQLDGGYWAMPP